MASCIYLYKVCMNRFQWIRSFDTRFRDVPRQLNHFGHYPSLKSRNSKQRERRLIKIVALHCVLIKYLIIIIRTQLSLIPVCLFSCLRKCVLNTFKPRQNGRHFADDIFKSIFFNENVWIPIKISLKFISRGPINNIPALVQIMAWRLPGDKPLSEPMMVSLTTHICVTRPQWVNLLGRKQNGHHFRDGIFNCIALCENLWIFA